VRLYIKIKKNQCLGEAGCDGRHQWLYQDQMSEVTQIKHISGKQLADRIRFQGKQVGRRKKIKKIMKHYKIHGTGIVKYGKGMKS